MKGVLFFLFFLLLIPSVMAESNDIQTILDRLFLIESNDNEICEDGENPLIDKDCDITLEDITTGNVFGYMWFFRLVLLITLILLIKKSRFWQLSAVLPSALFIYHGALGTSNSLNKPGVACSIFNLGQCFFPENPFFGWILVIIIVMMITLFIMEKENNKIYKQPRIRRY